MGRLEKISASVLGLAAALTAAAAPAIGAGVSISGRVLDAGGRGIAGARVRAFSNVWRGGGGGFVHFVDIIDYFGPPPAVIEAISKDDGSFRITGLEEVSHTVIATAAGHSPAERSNLFAPRKGIEFNLKAGSRFTGLVVGPDGSPIDGAEVQAFPPMDLDASAHHSIIEIKLRPSVDKVVTGKGGRFQFETLGAGTYHFTVTAKGFRRNAYLKIPLEEGENPPRRFELAKGLRISGVVQSESCRPIAGARIKATSTRNRKDFLPYEEDEVATDARGQFTFDTLEAGKYTLLVSHQDHATEQVRDVEAGNEDITITLPVGGAISGMVTEARTGRPIAGARVSVDDMQALRKEAVTDVKGQYSIAGLNARTLTKRYATIQADGYVRRSNVRVVVEDLNLTGNQNFELERTAVVEGRVVDRNGGGISGAQVLMKRRSSEWVVAATIGKDETGEDGRYRLEELEAGRGNVILASARDYLTGSSDPFQFQPGESFSIPDIVLSMAGAIEGAVMGADGKGLEGVDVSVRGQFVRATSDEKGLFSLKGLSGGTIDLEARSGHHLDAVIPGVNVAPDQVTRGVRIVLQKGSSLKGTVKDSEGLPIGGAQVVLLDISEDGMKEIRDESDDRGEFIIEGIRSKATVEVTVKHPGFLDFNDERISVNTGELKIVLKKLGNAR